MVPNRFVFVLNAAKNIEFRRNTGCAKTAEICLEIYGPIEGDKITPTAPTKSAMDLCMEGHTLLLAESCGKMLSFH